MRTKKPLISISIPVLNEEDNLLFLYDRLDALSKKMSELCDIEFVFSDNHSDDRTWDILQDLSSKDDRIKGIRFSKNYGFQRSIFANYIHTSGDAVMQIDADLQDPPEMLSDFFTKWQQGYHVVYGVRKNRIENVFIKTLRRVGYWFIDKISEHSIPRDAGDFRLIDRKVVDALIKMSTPTPYLRGMIAGLGFNQIGIDYDRSARVAGESKFNVPRLMMLGLTAVFNHSVVPLRLASFLGGAMLFLSSFGALYYFLLKFLYPELPPGLASIHILVLFGIGLNAFLLGLIGEYLLRIYLVVRSEPIAIIEQSLNISEENLRL